MCFVGINQARHPAPAADEQFWFDYGVQPAGKRTWRKLSDRLWQEAWPDGSLHQFRVLSRWDSELGEGYVIRRLPDEGMDVFIPELKDGAMLQWREAGKKPWHKLAAMRVEKP